jgi:predicted nuclease of predicted toxin-antitoxin system
MIIWIDAQLPPVIAEWITARFDAQAAAVRDLGLRDASDQAIFAAARQSNAVVMTKDSDFVQLLDAYGPPPQVILITCGNSSNARLKFVLDQTLARAISLIQAGESLVEIGDWPSSESQPESSRLI